MERRAAARGRSRRLLSYMEKGTSGCARRVFTPCNSGTARLPNQRLLRRCGKEPQPFTRACTDRTHQGNEVHPEVRAVGRGPAEFAFRGQPVVMLRVADELLGK